MLQGGPITGERVVPCCWRNSPRGGPILLAKPASQWPHAAGGRQFSPEFKAEVVDLVRRPGNSAGSVARELGLTETAVRAWAKQADLDQGRRSDGLTSEQLSEMAQLRKELREAREERDILKRAVAFFARETR
jgi:transposase